MQPRPLVVTTARRLDAELGARTELLGKWLDAPVVPRDGSLPEMCARHGVPGVLVVGANRVVYYEPHRGLEYFYHPGMVKARLHSHRRGDPDPMIQAMAVGAGDEVLDCTLGRASDAILTSWVVGESGRVVGLEVSPLLAALTRDGIAHYTDPSRAVTATLRRIVCQHADYRHYLPQCADNTFDVVYFDPLFHIPVEESPAMGPLRELADCSPLDATAVAEARRVARRRVVIKQRKGTPLWAQLGVTRLTGSRKGRIQYGIIAADGAADEDDAPSPAIHDC